VRAIWSAVDAAAAPVSALIMTAGLVRALSASDYGVLIIALAASGLSTAINPAIAATTTKFVSEARGREDAPGHTAAGVITASLIAVVLIDVVLLAIAFVLRDQLAQLVFGAASNRSNVGSLLLLAVLAVSLQQVDSVLAAAIRGLERFSHQAVAEICSRLALTAVLVATAWLTGNLQWVLIGQCVICALSGLARAALLRALLPERRILSLPARAEFAAIFHYGAWMWVSAIAGVAYLNGDRIIVGHVLGAAAAGQYNVYVQIAQLTHYVPSSLFAFSFPAFSRLGARGGDGRAQISRSYRRYRVTIIATALSLALVIVLARQPLLSLFAGNAFAREQDILMGLLVASFFLLACNVASYYLLLALGASKPVSLISTGSMLLALALTVILVPAYGLNGAAVGRLAYGLGTLALLERAQRVLR
jgi:O-antigen/teichoic acid export membrane protein